MIDKRAIVGSLLRGAWARFMAAGRDPQLEASIAKLDRVGDERLAACRKGDALDEALDDLAGSR